MSAADVTALLDALTASVREARARRGEPADPPSVRDEYRAAPTRRVARPVPHNCPGHDIGCPVCEGVGHERGHHS